MSKISNLLGDRLSEPTAAQGNLQVDKLLQAIVAIPEKTTIELTITLNVGGLIISGQLISRDDYFEDLTRLFSNASSESNVPFMLSDFFRDLGRQLVDGAHDDGAEGIPLPRFIHLRNAKMYPDQGQGLPHTHQVLWRGRLSQVDGFMLGDMP